MIYGLIILSYYSGHKLKLLVLYHRKDQIVLFIMILKIIALSCLVGEDQTKLDSILSVFSIGKPKYGLNFLQNSIKAPLSRELIIHQNYYTLI